MSLFDSPVKINYYYSCDYKRVKCELSFVYSKSMHCKIPFSKINKKIKKNKNPYI